MEVLTHHCQYQSFWYVHTLPAAQVVSPAWFNYGIIIALRMRKTRVPVNISHTPPHWPYTGTSAVTTLVRREAKRMRVTNAIFELRMR